MNGGDLSVIRLRIFSPSNRDSYSLEDLAKTAQVPVNLVSRYVEEGLIRPAGGHDPHDWWFDEEAVFELRRIQRLRRDLGVNIAGVAVIQQLLEQIEELKRELDRRRAS